MSKYILVIDQGTTSTRAILFDKHGDVFATQQEEFTQYYPNPGWVEHDALEIWASVVNVVSNLLIKNSISPKDIASIGITNQRETVVVWDKNSGKPIYHALVWQSRQSQNITDDLIKKGYQEIIHQKTGLIINPYFSASKIKWILDNVEGARIKANNNELLCGTIDSWLVWKLTDGLNHITDYTNASRTMLFNINSLQWDDELLELFDIPKSMLPEVRSSSEVYGYASQLSAFETDIRIPISSVIGDQQASLFGHCCFNKGDVKNTYGTGCFMLMNTGERPIFSSNGLLTTIAWNIDGKVEYALEGSVFIGGAVIQWLRDGLELVENARDSEQLALSLQSNDGVYLVPAFVGLGTPYWDNDARGAIYGLTRGTTKAHIARASLESIAYQSRDVLEVMKEESGNDIATLAVDGGASNNKFLMQIQSDLLQCEISLPKTVEATALGAAYLAGLAINYYKDKETILSNHTIKQKFIPSISLNESDKLYEGWKKAVKSTITFK